MDYLKFRLRSLTILHPIYSLLCGSSSELPMKYLKRAFTDYDILFHCYDICAIPGNRNPPKNTRCTIFRIDSTESPPGYTKLRIDGDRTRDRPSYYRRPSILDNTKSGGPSLETERMSRHTSREHYKNGRGNASVDIVYAVYCPYWPVEAEEWRKRKRFQGWPNEKLIARITRGGCHFVSKLRTWSSSDHTEWRFSFSKAELLLIHSWTRAQKMIYYIIRGIKIIFSKHLGSKGKKGFQTYFFKTLMFWACEEFPPEFWREENTITCVETLLLRFLKCLEDKHCPSYFIPQCNIMEHLLSEGSFQEEIQMLHRCLVGGYVSRGCNAIMSNTEAEFISLVSIDYLCLQKMWSSVPIIDDLFGRFSQHLFECEWFLQGMKYLHSAVEAHLRLMSLDNIVSRKASNDYVECLEKFERAVIRNEDFESFRYSNPELSEQETLRVILLRKQSRYAIPIYRRNFRNNFEDDAREQMLKESFPSPLFCAASAYRANFYFTAMQSYKESLAEINRYLDVVNKAKLIFDNGDPEEFASYIPVLICNSLSLIYDEHLQVILGFATLHRNISFSESSISSTGHEVCLKLNTWEFLKYLYIQSGEKVSAVPRFTACFYDSYAEYCQPCMSQLIDNAPYSAVILFAALRQSMVFKEPLRSKLIPRILYRAYEP